MWSLDVEAEKLTLALPRKLRQKLRSLQGEGQGLALRVLLLHAC